MMEMIFLSHLLISAALFIAVAITSAFIRKPQLRHALWALVLLKLIVPPIALFSFPSSFHSRKTVDAGVAHVQISSSSNQVTVRDSDSQERPLNALHLPQSPVRQDPSIALESSNLMPAASTKVHWKSTLLALWLVGSLVYLASVMLRLFQLQKLLECSSKVPADLEQTVKTLGKKLGLRKSPLVRYVDIPISPLICSLNFTPTLLLPKKLVSSFDAAQLDTVLTHELAHLRRRDHLLRWLEVFTLLVFWWNPIAWLAQKKLREAEEECCDAWVVWALPCHRRVYGLALLQTNEFLVNGVVPSMPLASTFGRPFFKRRIELIMRSHMHHQMSRLTVAIFLSAACVVLPVGAQNPNLPQEETSQRSTAESTVAAESKPKDQPSISQILAAIKDVCDANSVSVSAQEVDARVSETARKFAMSSDEFLGHILEQRGFTADQFKADFVWPMIALQKLSEIKQPKAMVPIVAEHVQAIKISKNAQRSKKPTGSPAMTGWPTKPEFSAAAEPTFSKSSELKSAMLQSEVEFLRAKVKFLEAQLIELRPKN